MSTFSNNNNNNNIWDEIALHIILIIVALFVFKELISLIISDIR